MNNCLNHKDCPPLWDYKFACDYRPSCYVHDLMMKQNGITNSYDLKLFLIDNATKLQKLNRDFFETKYSCASSNGYYLADPNFAGDYWKQYNQWINYGDLMNIGSPITPPVPIPY